MYCILGLGREINNGNAGQHSGEASEGGHDPRATLGLSLGLRRKELRYPYLETRIEKPTPGSGGLRPLQAKARLAALLLALVLGAACGGCSHTVTPPGPTGHYVVLSWAASTSSGVIGYNIYRGTTSGGPYPTKLNSSPVTGTTYTDDTVQAGETCYYVATAIASDGVTESAYSDEASATVPSS